MAGRCMTGEGAFTVEAGASLSSPFRLFSPLFSKTWTTSFSPLFIETWTISFFLLAGEGSTSPVSFSFPCRCSCSCPCPCPWLEGEFLLTWELPSFLFVFLLTTGGMSTSAARSSTRFEALATVVLDLDSGGNLTCSCSCSCARSEGVLSTCEGAVDALVILCALLCREGEGSMSTAFEGSVSGPGTCARAAAGTAGESIADIFRCGVVLV